MIVTLSKVIQLFGTLMVTNCEEVSYMSVDTCVMCGDIVPEGRMTIIDDDTSSVGSRDSYDDTHDISLNFLLQGNTSVIKS